MQNNRVYIYVPVRDRGNQLHDADFGTPASFETGLEPGVHTAEGGHLRAVPIPMRQLLTDDEMFTMEDLVADSVEEWEEDIEEDGGSRMASEKVSRLVKLSGVMASDATFARRVVGAC